MRKQIAAANWKMNGTLQDARALLGGMAEKYVELKENQEVIVSVPFPYLMLASEVLSMFHHYHIAAQNCSQHESGAYTGEVSAAMVASCGASHVIIGHSERREYFKEDNDVLASKVKQALKNGLTPIFCCGEELKIREKGNQNEFVANQIKGGIFDLEADAFSELIIAYEPIWAIGTGKTATAEQAQEMHAFIRQTIAEKYGIDVAGQTSILYGGSVKAENAKEIFGKQDVDGGLVGGASLKADAFQEIINSLKV